MTLPQEDLDHILTHTPGLWEPLRNQRLFITGGTGFFGTWLLHSLAHANDQLQLNTSAVVLTRNPTPAFCHPSISYHTSDVRDFAFPPGIFTHIIHAATPASETINNNHPLEMLDTITLGTRRVLDFAAACGCQKFLLTSSGAIYGKSLYEPVPETYPQAPAPQDPHSAYAQGKRLAEFLCTAYADKFTPTITRGFAFVGPHFPLDIHFAIGNFLRDALAGKPIHINGDGTPLRSYLYAADLAIWLWTILLRGQPNHPYNVGSDQPVSIAALAHEIAAQLPTKVHIAKTPDPNTKPSWYVPSIDRAKNELGLQVWINRHSAIERTIRWHQQRR